MAAFVVPWSPPENARWWVEGNATGPVSVHAVREGIYTGTIAPDARVWACRVEEVEHGPPPVDQWPLASSVSAFAGVLRVRGVALGPVDGARRLAAPVEARPQLMVRLAASIPAAEPEPEAPASPPDESASGLLAAAARRVLPTSLAPSPRAVPQPHEGLRPAPSLTVPVLRGPAPRRAASPLVVFGGLLLVVSAAMAWLLSR